MGELYQLHHSRPDSILQDRVSANKGPNDDELCTGSITDKLFKL